MTGISCIFFHPIWKLQGSLGMLSNFRTCVGKYNQPPLRSWDPGMQPGVEQTVFKRTQVSLDTVNSGSLKFFCPLPCKVEFKFNKYECFFHSWLHPIEWAGKNGQGLISAHTIWVDKKGLTSIFQACVTFSRCWQFIIALTCGHNCSRS